MNNSETLARFYNQLLERLQNDTHCLTCELNHGTFCFFAAGCITNNYKYYLSIEREK